MQLDSVGDRTTAKLSSPGADQGWFVPHRICWLVVVEPVDLREKSAANRTTRRQPPK